VDSDVKQAIEIYNEYGEVYESMQENSKNKKNLSKILHAMMGNVRGEKILDVGCGAEKDSKIMAEKGANVIGIDVSPKMIALANERCKGLNVRFYIADMEKTCFKDEEFNIITSIFSISHKKNLRKVLKEFHKILKKSGKIFVVVSPPYKEDDKIY
jgi:ubiquinone/menaquinone biosynthesis C-methylase UbiE